MAQKAKSASIFVRQRVPRWRIKPRDGSFAPLANQTAVPLVLSRIATTVFQTACPILPTYASVSASLIRPMFRETRQTNAMTSQVLIRNRPSECLPPGAGARFAFKDSMIHWVVQLEPAYHIVVTGRWSPTGRRIMFPYSHESRRQFRQVMRG